MCSPERVLRTLPAPAPRPAAGSPPDPFADCDRACGNTVGDLLAVADAVLAPAP